LNPEIELCRREIAEVEALINAGHPDLEGLCLALADWCAELRLIERDGDQQTRKPASSRSRGGQKSQRESYFLIE
jgi:hypothetical protein